MKNNYLRFLLFIVSTAFISLWSSNAYCVKSITAKGGDMEREVHLGMTKQELIEQLGAPDRIKSNGYCFHYDVFDISVFLNKKFQAERIYMGKRFSGTVKKISGEDVYLDDIFTDFGSPLETIRRTYAPSTSIQNLATEELEDKLTKRQQQEELFPMEYRGNRKLFELYSHDLVIKHKYAVDDEGISFYLDKDKNLYATVIYPVGEPELPSFQMIHFDFDRYNIKDMYVPILNKYIDYMKEDPSIYVTIQGHTDAKGTDVYNQRLSDKRAKAVYHYFLNHGITAKRLKIEGYGEGTPIADNTTPAGKDNPDGRALNRRAQFEIKRME